MAQLSPGEKFCYQIRALPAICYFGSGLMVFLAVFSLISPWFGFPREPHEERAFVFTIALSGFFLLWGKVTERAINWFCGDCGNEK